VFLEINGIEVEVAAEDLIVLFLDIASSKLSRDDVEQTLQILLYD